MKFILKTLIVLSISACNFDGGKPRFKAGVCVKEEKNYYASYHKQKGVIYFIHDASTGGLRISSWHNRSWLYYGDKKVGYFKDKKSLVYTKINCPDRRGNASITDKLKSIDL